MSFEVIRTREGAHAVLDHDCGELMHPLGPRIEAETLYVGPSRLEARLREGPVTLFDVGLGAGSNAIAAWQKSETRSAGHPLEIISFDRTADALALVLEEAHAAAFGFDSGAISAAQTMIATGVCETPRTTWRLVLGELLGTLSAPSVPADIVFWDMYSAQDNPGLWGVQAFRAIRSHCGPRATLHTYGAATASRAAMFLGGFAVGRGPPIGKKADTTIAAVNAADLDAPLGERWLQRFERSHAALPKDAPADARRQVTERLRSQLR